MKNFFKNKHIYLLLIFSLISVFSYSQDQLIRILEDSLTVLGKKYASVGYVKIKKITSNDLENLKSYRFEQDDDGNDTRHNIVIDSSEIYKFVEFINSGENELVVLFIIFEIVNTISSILSNNKFGV